MLETREGKFYDTEFEEAFEEGYQKGQIQESIKAIINCARHLSIFGENLSIEEKKEKLINGVFLEAQKGNIDEIFEFVERYPHLDAKSLSQRILKESEFWYIGHSSSD